MMLWDNFSQKKNASVHIRQIVGNQLNRLRIEVSEMFFAGKIKVEAMDELYGKVMEASTEKQNMAREVVNVKNALSSGEVSLTPDLSSAESQLLWGTALACVVCGELAPAGKRGQSVADRVMAGCFRSSGDEAGDYESCFFDCKQFWQ